MDKFLGLNQATRKRKVEVGAYWCYVCACSFRNAGGLAKHFKSKPGHSKAKAGCVKEMPSASDELDHKYGDMSHGDMSHDIGDIDSDDDLPVQMTHLGILEDDVAAEESSDDSADEDDERGGYEEE